MNTRKRWTAALALLVLMGTGEASGQVSFGVNTYLSYTDNLFQNHNRQSDWVTLTYLDFDYRPGANLNLYYTGSANVFAEYEDLFSHRHVVGLGYSRSNQKHNALYSGVELGARLDRPVYRYYDYLQGDTYLSGKVHIPGSLLSRGGYRLRYREYLNARDYSFVEQSIFGQLKRSWQTGTSLQVRGDLGVKTYAREATGDSSDAIFRTRGGGGSIQAQALLRVRIAQAVARGTGLQMEFLRRVNVYGHNRYTELENYDGEENPFDDRYSYGGREIRGTLKHLGSVVRVEVTGRYVWRDYEDRPALDLDGAVVDLGILRQDRRKSLQFEVEKVLSLPGMWLREVGLQAKWLYLDVDSNDPYYSAATQVYSVGLRLGF